MGDDEIPYHKVRAVRDETGASHENCRAVLVDTGGDVAAAVSLWFARRRGALGAPGGQTGDRPDHAKPQSNRS